MPSHYRLLSPPPFPHNRTTWKSFAASLPALAQRLTFLLAPLSRSTATKSFLFPPLFLTFSSISQPFPSCRSGNGRSVHLRLQHEGLCTLLRVRISERKGSRPVGEHRGVGTHLRRQCDGQYDWSLQGDWRLPTCSSWEGNGAMLAVLYVLSEMQNIPGVQEFTLPFGGRRSGTTSNAC